MHSVTEQNVAEVPLYTPLDVARYLHVSPWAVLAFSTQDPSHVFAGIDRLLRDLHARLPFEDEYGPPRIGEVIRCLSFRELAKLFVLTPVFQALDLDLSPRWLCLSHKGLSLLIHHVREIATRIGEDPRVFTDPSWVLDCSERDSASVSGGQSEHGQVVKRIAMHQARVEFQDGVPVRLFPFSRPPAVDAPRTVLIDPELRFGRPTVKGVPTDVLLDRWHAGDSAAELAQDYDLTTDEVEEALRYETVPHPLLSSFKWVG